VRKARFLTQFNQVVGALVITQRRLKGTCPVIDNTFITRYTATKEPKLGPVCRGSEVSSAPFGVDPSFSGASSLFRGDASSSQFYAPWEIGDTGEPFGFFPHSYDGMNRTNKSSNLIWSTEASNFKLLFSDRLSGAEANRLITYMIDGGFIDRLTDEVKVEIITLNVNLKMFSIFEFTFNWKVCLSLASKSTNDIVGEQLNPELICRMEEISFGIIEYRLSLSNFTSKPTKLFSSWLRFYV
jgi:hypothetical protein